MSKTSGGGPSIRAPNLLLFSSSTSSTRLWLLQLWCLKVAGSTALSSALTLDVLFSPVGKRSFPNSHPTPHPGSELQPPVSRFWLYHLKGHVKLSIPVSSCWPAIPSTCSFQPASSLLVVV